MSYQIKITTLSDTIIGGAEGHGSIIDTDICFDEYGVPYIPARRIKGCIRDSAKEVTNFIKSLDLVPPDIAQIFGNRGFESSEVEFFNANLINYKNNLDWIIYFLESNDSPFTAENVKSYFSQIHQMTEINIDTGVAKDKSLRNVRSIRKGLDFGAKIRFINAPTQDMVHFLSYCVRNLRYLGSKRTRGFGKVNCQLLHNGETFKPNIDSFTKMEVQ